MSSGQKKYQNSMQTATNQAAADQKADRDRMMKDTPETAWLRDIAKRGAEWISAKNYSSTPPGLFKYDLSAPEKRQKMREADLNLQPTGAFALGAGGTNPQALAMARLRLNDQMDQDDAGNYEGAVNNYMDEIKGMNSDLAGFDFTKDNALLGNAFNRWNSAQSSWGHSANQPPMWMSLAAGGLNAAGQMGAAALSHGA